MARYQDEQKTKALDAADAEWFAARMKALVDELQDVTLSPRKTAFLNGCLKAAMRQRAVIVNAPDSSTDDYDF